MPAQPTESAESEPLINAMDELSALDKQPVGDAPDAAQPPKEPAAPKVEQPKKEASKAPDKAAPKVEAKKADEKPGQEKAKGAEAPQETNFKQLKASVARYKDESEAFKKERDELKARLSSSGDIKPLQEQNAAKDKQIAELKTKLGEADFTQQDEYQNNFYKPYVSTWTRAIQSVMGLQINGENGASHSLSKDEAEFLLSMPDAKALDEARRVFGDNNITALTLLTTHKNRIAEAHEKMTEGRGNFQKAADERKSKQSELEKTQNESRAKLWAEKNAEIVESDEWLKPDEGDPESEKLLAKGYEEVAAAFSDDPEITPEKRIESHAMLRNHAAAYHRLVAAIKSRDEKIAAQDTELAGFRDSEPGAEKTPRNNGTDKRVTPESIEQELAEMDRKGR